jgi:hypothetical protein
VAVTGPIPGVTRPRTRPIRPSADEIRRQNELTAWHAEWATKWADRAGFHPAEHPKPGSDYNLHHVLLDAPQEARDEFYRRADEIMGRRPAA